MSRGFEAGAAQMRATGFESETCLQTEPRDRGARPIEKGFEFVPQLTRLAGTGMLAPSQAAAGILIAYVSNLAFKLAMIGVIGTRQMFNWTLLCFVCLALPALLIVV